MPTASSRVGSSRPIARSPSCVANSRTPSPGATRSTPKRTAGRSSVVRSGRERGRRPRPPDVPYSRQRCAVCGVAEVAHTAAGRPFTCISGRGATKKRSSARHTATVGDAPRARPDNVHGKLGGKRVSLNIIRGRDDVEKVVGSSGREYLPALNPTNDVRAFSGGRRALHRIRRTVSVSAGSGPPAITSSLSLVCTVPMTCGGSGAASDRDRPVFTVLNEPAEYRATRYDSASGEEDGWGRRRLRGRARRSPRRPSDLLTEGQQSWARHRSTSLCGLLALRAVGGIVVAPRQRKPAVHCQVMALCRICTTRDANSGEHVVLSALGGRIVVRDLLCKPCNEELGHTIDAGIAEQFEGIRALLAIRGDRRQVASVEATNEKG
jgi:hypothetical protein